MTKENKKASKIDHQKENKTINQLKKEITELTKEKEEYLQGWQRARADFINYRKSQENEGFRARKAEKRRLIKKILEILDNFYLAEEKIDEKELDDNYLKGLSKIREQFEKFLAEEGVQELKTVGEEFDPVVHEAVTTIDSDKKSDLIVEEIKKGYLINGELLRPAKVKVSK